MLLARAHETVAAVAGGLGVSLGPIDRQTDRQNLQRENDDRTNERTNEGLKALFPRSHTHAHTAFASYLEGQFKNFELPAFSFTK